VDRTAQCANALVDVLTAGVTMEYASASLAGRASAATNRTAKQTATGMGCASTASVLASLTGQGPRAISVCALVCAMAMVSVNKRMPPACVLMNSPDPTANIASVRLKLPILPAVEMANATMAIVRALPGTLVSPVKLPHAQKNANSMVNASLAIANVATDGEARIA